MLLENDYIISSVDDQKFVEILDQFKILVLTQSLKYSDWLSVYNDLNIKIISSAGEITYNSFQISNFNLLTKKPGLFINYKT